VATDNVLARPVAVRPVIERVRTASGRVGLTDRQIEIEIRRAMWDLNRSVARESLPEMATRLAAHRLRRSTSPVRGNAAPHVERLRSARPRESWK
jgi:hypothetical protein